MKRVRLIIKGRVQGVGYRAFVERAAGELGLSGWVRNRADGTVEALIEGDGAAVDAFIARCKDGPAMAHVSDVVVTESDETVPRGFMVRPDA